MYGLRPLADGERQPTVGIGSRTGLSRLAARPGDPCYSTYIRCRRFGTLREIVAEGRGCLELGEPLSTTGMT
jgi:hypothetical protein